MYMAMVHWERPEYWEESWRLEKTCCHSNSNEKPSADVNSSEGVNDNISSGTTEWKLKKRKVLRTC